MRSSMMLHPSAIIIVDDLIGHHAKREQMGEMRNV
jgi:hypothetical protein